MPFFCFRPRPRSPTLLLRSASPLRPPALPYATQQRPLALHAQSLQPCRLLQRRAFVFVRSSLQAHHLAARSPASPETRHRFYRPAADRMFGDMEMVRNAQQDAPTFRRVSLDLSQSQQQRANPLRRLSTSSSISSTSSVSQASSPTFSSSVPTSHTFWPAGDKVSGLSGLFRSGSTQLPQPQQLSPIQGTPDVKVPALIRSLSKGMDAFR